jgi:hypothetical protein
MIRHREMLLFPEKIDPHMVGTSNWGSKTIGFPLQRKQYDRSIWGSHFKIAPT